MTLIVNRLVLTAFDTTAVLRGRWTTCVWWGKLGLFFLDFVCVGGVGLFRIGFEQGSVSDLLAFAWEEAK